MLTNDKLIKKLNKDVDRLQNMIEHRKFYNICNFVIRALLKSGIAIDYALPFIVSALIIINIYAEKGNVPFRIDEVMKKANIETIDISSGIHIEHLSYDFDYDNELIEYSTGWFKNDNGLYERTVTSYKISDEIDLEDTENIMKMSKEELEKILKINNISTIKKDVLTEEDSIYNIEAIIVTNHFESENYIMNRPETSGENVLNSLLYIITVLFSGSIIMGLERILVKTYIRDKLKEYQISFRHINKNELERMRKILKVKQENLAMLINEETNIDNIDGYSYKLRK